MKKYMPADERGFILVWSLLLLIVVTLLGAAGMSTAIYERRMAANEALYKQAFYEADGGTENALSILVENINCVSGFSDENLDGDLRMNTSKLNIWLQNYLNEEPEWPSDCSDNSGDNCPDRDFHYPADYGPNDPHTNGRVAGRSKLMTGANLPMLAGYEGKGKALGSDGAALEYDIKAEHIGPRNSKVGIHTKFRLDNQFASYPSGTCKY